VPVSSPVGKPWLLDRITARRPDSLLDIGPGSGTYARLLRPRLPSTRMIGLEVFEPYVHTYGLHSLYDQIIIGDARTAPLPPVDVVVMGDVIEHMSLADAVTLWARAREAATVAVYLSLPIIEWPQDASHGNEHEAHLHTWSHDLVLSELDGITAFETTETIGVYEATSEQGHPRHLHTQAPNQPSALPRVVT
jgi:trans-aconitate methyltransferase